MRGFSAAEAQRLRAALVRGGGEGDGPKGDPRGRHGDGSKLNHQDMDRRFQSMLQFSRASHFGYLFLTHSHMVRGQK